MAKMSSCCISSTNKFITHTIFLAGYCFCTKKNNKLTHYKTVADAADTNTIYCQATSSYCTFMCVSLKQVTCTFQLQCPALNVTAMLTVLHCMTPRCTTLYFAGLRCTTLHYSGLHYTALHRAALRCTVLDCTSQYCAALRCSTLHCVALKCI